MVHSMSQTVERSSLDLRYQSYRLRNGAAEARLLASIAERGICGTALDARHERGGGGRDALTQQGLGEPAPGSVEGDEPGRAGDPVSRLLPGLLVHGHVAAVYAHKRRGYPSAIPDLANRVAGQHGWIGVVSLAQLEESDIRD